MLRYSRASRGAFYLMCTFSSVICSSINNRMVKPCLAETSFQVNESCDHNRIRELALDRLPSLLHFERQRLISLQQPTPPVAARLRRRR